MKTPLSKSNLLIKPSIVARLAGYDSRPENIAKLISLTHEQKRVVKTALNSKRIEIITVV